MYNLKNIVTYNEEIILPKCMYRLKNPNLHLNEKERNESIRADEDEINICNQVKKFFKARNKKMVDLELRQDQLLKKLDLLYEKIKTISSICNTTNTVKAREVQQVISEPDEIVLVTSPDNLPWFLNILLKESINVNILWHIHSSVPNDKVAKINAFVKKLINSCNKSTVTLRLIFKCVSFDSELKLSSLALPIVGNVNILRYLSFIYPSVLPYDGNDHIMDGLLDICHVLERAPEKNRDQLIKKIFEYHKNWIHNGEFSIVDLVVYNTIKQWQNGSKYVPKQWLQNCEKLCNIH